MHRGKISHGPPFWKKIVTSLSVVFGLMFMYILFGPLTPPLIMIPHDLAVHDCPISAVTQISWAPRSFIRRNIITERERESILRYAATKLEVRAPVESRFTNSRAVTLETDTEELHRLDAILSEWVMLPQSFGEPFVVRKFQPGDSVKPHVDYFSGTLDSQRITTVVIFLEVPVSGGEFEFSESEKFFKPELSSALLYHSRIPNGQPDIMSLHNERHVLEGEKWTLTKYYRDKPIHM